jgi:ribosomal protein S18 acetylase RimI-like enzyme
VLIRLATQADIAKIAALVERYWQFESIDGFDRRQIESLLGSLLAAPTLGACWVSESEGRLSGYLVAVFMLSLEHGGLMAEIDEIFVLPEKRSAGLGALLVAQAEHDLAARGLLRLQLQLGVGNDRARLFYEKHGFRRRAGYELLDKALTGSPAPRGD